MHRSQEDIRSEIRLRYSLKEQPQWDYQIKNTWASFIHWHVSNVIVCNLLVVAWILFYALHSSFGCTFTLCSRSFIFYLTLYKFIELSLSATDNVIIFARLFHLQIQKLVLNLNLLKFLERLSVCFSGLLAFLSKKIKFKRKLRGNYLIIHSTTLKC